MFVTTDLSIDRTILPWFARKSKDILMFLTLLFSLFAANEGVAETDNGGLRSANIQEQIEANTEESATIIPLSKEELIALIQDAEVRYKIPLGLLKSIAHVESGQNQYFLNIAGRAIKAKTAREALSAVRQELAEGNNNIDLGVMQVNLRWHGKEFANLKQMIEPQGNIEYAAKLLCDLKKQHGSWHKAVRHYHSATPKHHTKYSRKVILSWLK